MVALLVLALVAVVGNEWRYIRVEHVVDNVPNVV